ncbi:MAG TPA: BON domain-containing protein [Chloroflexota bacterium]|nr:BON domain-containing protein [Chloroflexota bacterium]
MNYGYGPAAAGPYFNPYWSQPGWGGAAGFGGYPGYGGFGYGTTPYAPAYPWIRPDDAEVKYFVENQLDNDPEVPAHTNIGVDVKNGVVTLTGTVPNKRVKHAAGDDAWWIPQVLDVHNEINVVTRRERTEAGTTGTGTPSSRRAQTSGR